MSSKPMNKADFYFAEYINIQLTSTFSPAF